MGEKKETVFDVNEEIIDFEMYDEDRSIRLEDLKLSRETFNALKRGGYVYIADFERKTVRDLLRVRNLGKRGVLELKAALSVI